MKWININEKEPENHQRVMVFYKNDFGKGRITIAKYIKPKTVLAEDFLDPEYSMDFEEYDEEKDCYWTPAGFYESQYATDINWYLSETITHWMPLPNFPSEGNI
jgi:hypothetical protein